MDEKDWSAFGWQEEDRVKAGVFCRCAECHDVISNPVCPDCLTKQMKVVLDELNPKLSKEITSCQIDGETRCLSCGEKMGLCAHCFSKDVYFQLLEKNEDIAEEFLSRFDFDLRMALL